MKKFFEKHIVNIALIEMAALLCMIALCFFLWAHLSVCWEKMSTVTEGLQKAAAIGNMLMPGKN